MKAAWTTFVLLVLGCAPSPEPIIEIVYEDTGEGPEPASFEVTGTVVDWDGNPVEAAMVMIGGRDHEMVLTDDAGAFRLWYVEEDGGVAAVVAAKIGYRSRGFEYFDGETPVNIAIRKIEEPDNVEYTYLEPGDGIDNMQENCTHCHTSFVAQFLDLKHAEATKNPLVQDLYAGVNRLLSDPTSCEDEGGQWLVGHEPGTSSGYIEKCYIGAGVLGDINPNCGGDGELACDDPSLDDADQPDAFGACADCHAPGIDGVAGGRDLHDAHGLAYENGVHCDTCHKVADVDLSLEPGVGQRLIMGRPTEEGADTFEWEPVYYGPLKDVPNIIMQGSYQPKFNHSVFCAGCHEQNQAALIPGQALDSQRWPDGLPIHSTYSEWEAGPYNQEKPNASSATCLRTKSSTTPSISRVLIISPSPLALRDLQKTSVNTPFADRSRGMTASLIKRCM